MQDEQTFADMGVKLKLDILALTKTIFK
jgi:hypothetical protein